MEQTKVITIPEAIKKVKKSRLPRYVYIVLFVVVYLATQVISKFQSLDLYSWHLSYEEYQTQFLTLGDLIKFCLSNSIDFIYQSIVYLAARYSLSLNLITAITVTMYFYVIIKMMQKLYSGCIDYLVFALVLFTTPITWTVAITRNLLAVLFLYLGVIAYQRKQRVLMVLMLLASVYTHFSVIMYVAVLLIAMMVKNKRLSPTNVIITLSVVLVFSIATTNFVSDIINAFAIAYETRYSAYSEMDSNNFLFSTNINYGDKLPVLFALFLSVYLLIKSKRSGFVFWGLFFLTIMLVFFMFTSFFLINRCMLVMPIFWGMSIAELYKTGPQPERKNLQLIAMAGMVPILLHIFSYREYYFSFIF